MSKSSSGSKLWEHGASTVTFHMGDIQMAWSLVVTVTACEDDTFGGQTVVLQEFVV